MRGLVHILLLACADFRRERLLSLCSILGLTAVLAPLLILYGVKFGVMTTLTERLLSDPNTMEISPVSSGRFTEEDLVRWRREPGVAFVLPRTRSIAATMTLLAGSVASPVTTTVSLEPTAAGDPLLERWKVRSATMVPWQGGDGAPAAATTPAGGKTEAARSETKQPASEQPAAPGLRRLPAQDRARRPTLSRVPSIDDPRLRQSGAVLTEPAARRLGVKVGDAVLGRVERSSDGIVSSAWVRLNVAGVLPLAAQQKPTAYIPLELLLACEDFRDFRAVPELGAENGWRGDPRPTEDRVYPDFRLYALSLDDVARLRDYFQAKNIETYTHAEDIEQIQMLETGLNLIFTLICSTAAVGFFLSTASSVFAGIKRKERTLGLLQLMGFSTGSLMFFPLTQALLTAVLGSAFATGCYAGFSTVLNRLFAGALGSAGDVCRLNPEHILLAAGITCGISLLAALGPALHSTRIEPSEVIRDV